MYCVVKFNLTTNEVAEAKRIRILKKALKRFEKMKTNHVHTNDEFVIELQRWDDTKNKYVHVKETYL